MIPFHSPLRAQNQETYIHAALNSPALSGDGPFSGRTCELLSALTGVRDILLTPSATHALELAFFSLCAQDEVIVPCYNFPAAPNAVLRGGGKVVLCDVDPLTQNIDPKEVVKHISPRTKAICLTHYAGVACDMAALAEIANAHGLLLVEDAAQAIGASYQGRHLGSIGDFGCISFHATKNITCGEGGAYLHNTAKADFNIARMRRENGTNRYRFRAAVDRFYYWETIGSSHLLSDVSAALLLAQLEELAAVTARRQAICAMYDERLHAPFASGRLRCMYTPPYAQTNGHIYYFLCKDDADKRKIQAYMAQKGVPCLPHFAPLHLGGFGKALGLRPGDFPKSEHAANTLLRLPVHTGLRDAQIECITDTLLEAVKL